MSAQFTPGPWAIPQFVEGSHFVVAEADPEGRVIAAVWLDDLTQNVPDAEANAHLIAAAPELYEALASAMVMLGRYRRETPLGHQPHMIASEADAALIQGAAALAKARGES